jgi:hypothetical protein
VLAQLDVVTAYTETIVCAWVAHTCVLIIITHVVKNGAAEAWLTCSTCIPLLFPDSHMPANTRAHQAYHFSSGNMACSRHLITVVVLSDRYPWLDDQSTCAWYDTSLQVESQNMSEFVGCQLLPNLCHVKGTHVLTYHVDRQHACCFVA